MVGDRPHVHDRDLAEAARPMKPRVSCPQEILRLGTRIRVYRNLHADAYSVQTHERGRGWRVALHASRVAVSSVSFKVNEAGRQRVLKERRKNVHAYAEGSLTAQPGLCAIGWRRVGYNPYRAPTFTCDVLGAVSGADVVEFTESGKILARITYRALDT